MTTSINNIVRALLLLVVFTSAASVLIAQRVKNWESLSPAGGGFSVLLPGEPTADSESVDSKLGKLVNHTFAVKTTPAVYYVAYSKFPTTVTDADVVERMFDNARDSAVPSSNGELQSEKRIKLGPYAGREWIVRTPAGVLNARAYWANNTFYQLLFLALKTDASADVSVEDALKSKFFDSFKLFSNDENH